MNIWQTSWAYRIWVIGGLIGIVAFSIIGGMSDPGNQDFIFTLIPVIAVWMAGIFLLQWRGLQKDLKENPKTTKPFAGLLRWNIIFGAILCVAIFVGVYLFYKDPDNVWYPLGESGPGLPVFLIPAVVLVIYGALRTLHVVRELSRGGAPDQTDLQGPTDFEGPTDIQAPERSSNRH